MTSRLASALVPLVVVALLALVGVALLGVWPPLVAVETGSMEPGVERGDMIVLSATDRYPAGDLAGSEEPNTARETFGSRGDVIVFIPPENEGPPILHRIAFPVEAGEDWTTRVDEEPLHCARIQHCPAQYDGYITHGDANEVYDQQADIAPVVHDDWIVAKAQFRVPYLGWLRLGYDAAVEAVGPAGALGTVVVVGGAIGGVVTLIRLRYERQRW